MESTRYGSSWDGQCWIDRETLRWCGAKLGEIWASWSSQGLLFSGASDSVGVCGEGALARLKLYTTLEQKVLSDPETSISPKGRKIGFPRSSLSVCQPPPGEYNSQYLQKTYSPGTWFASWICIKGFLGQEFCCVKGVGVVHVAVNHVFLY